MKPALFALALLIFPHPLSAQTKLLNLDALASKTVYDVAEVMILAVSENGKPAVVLLDLDVGEVVPPHSADSGTRLMTVLSGDMSWGDGDAVDPTQERLYPAGSVLVLPPDVPHWLAARNGPVRLQLVVMDDERLTEGVQEQLR